MYSENFITQTQLSIKALPMSSDPNCGSASPMCNPECWKQVSFYLMLTLRHLKLCGAPEQDGQITFRIRNIFPLSLCPALFPHLHVRSLHPFLFFQPLSRTLLPFLLFSFNSHKAVFYSHSWRAPHLFSLWNETPTLSPDQETDEREIDRQEYNRGDLSPNTDVEISEIVSYKIRFVISAYWYMEASLFFFGSLSLIPLIHLILYTKKSNSQSIVELWPSQISKMWN